MKFRANITVKLCFSKDFGSILKLESRGFIYELLVARGEK